MIVISWILLGTGLFIMFFGALGTIILPDLFQRFHASTKCAVSGAFSLLLGMAFYANNIHFSVKFFIIAIFIIITSPLVAHMLAISRMEDEKEVSNV